VGTARALGTLTDSDLLVLARSDREAFAEIYRRHATGVLAYFSRALGRSDLAFDLTAETFAAALLAVQKYQPTAAPDGHGCTRSRITGSWIRCVKDRPRRERGRNWGCRRSFSRTTGRLC
jgi:hypothetical protein